MGDNLPHRPCSGHISDNDQSGCHPDSGLKSSTDAVCEMTDGLNEIQACIERPFRIVFVSAWIAEIDENAVSNMTADETIVASHNACTAIVVGLNHRAQLFRVEATGQSCGSHKIAKHDREVPSFRLKCRLRR